MLKHSPFVASSDRDFVKQFGQPDEVRTIPTLALSDLLDRQSVKTVVFMSMDIELNEPKALQGFDIDRFKPSLVRIGGLLPVRQGILDYLAKHHYVIVGKYIWVDRENLYFMPLGSAPLPPVNPVFSRPARRRFVALESGLRWFRLSGHQRGQPVASEELLVFPPVRVARGFADVHGPPASSRVRRARMA